MDLLPHLLQANQANSMKHFLQIVSLTPEQAAGIQDSAKSSEMRRTVEQFLQIKQGKKDVPDTNPAGPTPSKVQRLISTAGKRISELKKVTLLEAAVLFGSAEKAQSVWDQYRPFEFLNRAICLCVQTSRLDKLSILLQPESSFIYTDQSGSMKAKYGSWDEETVLKYLIEPLFMRPRFLDWNENDYEDQGLENPYHIQTNLRPIVLEAVNSTFQNSSGIAFTEADFPDKSQVRQLEALQMIAAWDSYVNMSDFLVYALFHGRISLAKSIFNSGESFTPESIDYLFSVDDPDSRRDVFYALSIASNEDREPRMKTELLSWIA